MKDLFSAQALDYARFRPTYPPELFAWLLERTSGRGNALDCATGNGQAAAELANYFQEVDAIDISEGQLQQAKQATNIHYQISRAENTPFDTNRFDLITMAQAFHWMDAPKFCNEMNRVGKPGALVAAWSYKFPQTDNDAVNRVINQFYHGVTGPYWEPERAHVDNDYAGLEWRFAGIETARFTSTFDWDRATLLGYFASWSATQKYIKMHGQSPLTFVEGPLAEVFPDGLTVRVCFSLFLKAGRVEK
jgi:SAM-dependent methyltransferase